MPPDAGEREHSVSPLTDAVPSSPASTPTVSAPPVTDFPAPSSPVAVDPSASTLNPPPQAPVDNSGGGAAIVSGQS